MPIIGMGATINGRLSTVLSDLRFSDIRGVAVTDTSPTQVLVEGGDLT